MNPKIAASLWKSKKVRAAVGIPIFSIIVLFAIIIIAVVAILSSGKEAQEQANNAYDKMCNETGISPGITFGGQMDVILQTIRANEHSGNTAPEIYLDPPGGAGSTASGGYQFLRGTWNGHKSIWQKYGDFSDAYLAPPNVQDEVAKAAVEKILLDNSVDLVGPIWLLGHKPTGAEWDKKIGLNPTPREYQAKWMGFYNKFIAATGAGTPGTSDTSVGSNAPPPMLSTGRSKARPDDNVAIGQAYAGFASVYANDPVTNFVDHGDNNIPALSGASNNNPGIAIYNHGTLGGWWYVVAPNGKAANVQQTDYGPSTSRMLDINAVAARSVFGYKAASFPTDQGNWTAKYLGRIKPAQAATTDAGGVGEYAEPAVDTAKLECNSGGAGATPGLPDASGLPTGPVGITQITNVQGIQVNNAVAKNVDAMLTAMKAAGLSPGGGGYRDPAGQLSVRRSNCGSSHYAIYEMPASSCSPPTARPGTSMHQRGLAIDFTCNGGGTIGSGIACFNWLRIHAAEYGYKNLPSEPWHWSTNGN